jgi:hypothetical protein
MTDAQPDFAALNAWWLEQAGKFAMALKSRRDQLRVIDGSRRMLGPKTPRPAVDLKIVLGEEPAK